MSTIFFAGRHNSRRQIVSGGNAACADRHADDGRNVALGSRARLAGRRRPNDEHRMRRLGAGERVLHNRSVRRRLKRDLLA